MERETIKHGEPFDFKQCVCILKSTGRNARDLRELKELLASVSDESLAHHTYQYFLSGHVFEYTNDFAQWAAKSLGEKPLSEYLSNVDPYSFMDINDLRQHLLHIIEGRLEEPPEPRGAMLGDEFYFSEAVTLVFPAGIRVQNLAEFLMGIRYVDKSSIYYHFYEARMRLRDGVDDFSRWFLGALGNTGLTQAMKGVDPFMHTLEGIRAHIIEAVEEEVRKDMEGLPL
jgi:hypothetical protein